MKGVVYDALPFMSIKEDTVRPSDLLNPVPREFQTMDGLARTNLLCIDAEHEQPISTRQRGR